MKVITNSKFQLNQTWWTRSRVTSDLDDTAVSREVVLPTGKTLRDNVESYYGVWANTKVFQPSGKNNTNTCILSFSFLVAESPWSSITQSQTLTTINANRHRRVRFHTFVGQPLSKQLYPELSITSLFWCCVHSAHMLFLVSQILDAVDLNSIADALMSWISWPHISFGRKILESR